MNVLLSPEDREYLRQMNITAESRDARLTGGDLRKLRELDKWRTAAVLFGWLCVLLGVLVLVLGAKVIAL